MKVLTSRSWTGRQWHIKSINGKSLCGVELRDHTKTLDLTDKRICPKCKNNLYKLLDQKSRINQILKTCLP